MKLLKRIVLLLLLVAAAGGAFVWYQAHRLTAFAHVPFGPDQAATVDVPQGTGPRSLAAKLAAAGVVSDADLFYALIRKERAGPRLKAGEYEFQGPSTPSAVLAKLLSGQVKVYRFTVPEGLRAEEILPIVARSELNLSEKRLLTLSEDRAFLQRAGVPAGRIEGFLYPDTYTFTKGATEESVLTKMVSRALEEYRKAEGQRRPGNRLDLLEVMTLASIVEKETGAPEERPRISCVFHNRLRKGMKLQTDPTVLYAMRLLKGVYTKNITRKDLTTPHPYNTYTQFGLPPGPIASPGAAAIGAALNPPDCRDLYFVSRNDGTHIFCPDLKCHNQAVDEWQKQFFQKQRLSKRRK